MIMQPEIEKLEGTHIKIMKIDNHAHRMVFCDFDGTITKQETFVAMLNTFAPEKMKEFGRLFSKKKITLREGVKGVVESIPSSNYKSMVEFIKGQEIREGFEELLVFLKDNGVPFFVISGGLLDSVKTRLADYDAYISGIFAPGIDDSREYLKVISEYEEDNELVAKVKVMEMFSYDFSIAIGDGATDHKMAMSSSLVFARDRLAKFLDGQSKEYIEWDNFFDIKRYLTQLWKV